MRIQQRSCFRQKNNVGPSIYRRSEEKPQGPKLEGTSCCRALASLCAFHLQQSGKKRCDDATHVCLSLQRQGCVLVLEWGACSLPRKPPVVQLRDISAFRRLKGNSSSLIKPSLGLEVLLNSQYTHTTTGWYLSFVPSFCFYPRFVE